MNWVTAILGLGFFALSLGLASVSGVALNQTTFGYDSRRRAVEDGDLRVWGLTVLTAAIAAVLLLWR